MSWRLGTLAIALFGIVAVAVMAGGQQTQPADLRSDSPMVVSDDPNPAAAKPTDKELIEKQKTCPVTDQPLGSMGRPVKVVVKKQTVFLCCQGCKRKLLADPDKYLKKLDDQK